MWIHCGHLWASSSAKSFKSDRSKRNGITSLNSGCRRSVQSLVVYLRLCGVQGICDDLCFNTRSRILVPSILTKIKCLEQWMPVAHPAARSSSGNLGLYQAAKWEGKYWVVQVLVRESPYGKTLRLFLCSIDAAFGKQRFKRTRTVRKSLPAYDVHCLPRPTSNRIDNIDTSCNSWYYDHKKLSTLVSDMIEMYWFFEVNFKIW